MTTDVEQASPGNPPPPDKKQNVFERIAGVLFAPAETFRDIARRPDIVGPLLIILIVSYACTIVMLPKLDLTTLREQQAEQMRKRNPEISDEQLATIERMTAATTKVGMWVSPLLFVIWFAIMAGVLLLAFRLMGGEGTFKQAFSATLYAWIPLLIAGILMAIIAVARGSFDPVLAASIVKSNPAFLADMKEQPVLFALLASLDVFTMWTVALLIAGFAAVAKVSAGKSAAIVISLWIVLIVMKLGFTAMTA